MSRHIKRAFDKGLGWQGDFFRIKAYKRVSSGTDDRARLAVVASKKFSNLATSRNFCRRQLKDAFRKDMGDLSGWDIVILPKPKIIDCQFEKIQKEVGECSNFLRLYQ